MLGFFSAGASFRMRAGGCLALLLLQAPSSSAAACCCCCCCCLSVAPGWSAAAYISAVFAANSDRVCGPAAPPPASWPSSPRRHQTLAGLPTNTKLCSARKILHCLHLEMHLELHLELHLGINLLCPLHVKRLTACMWWVRSEAKIPLANNFLFWWSWILAGLKCCFENAPTVYI